ncbi:MAG TPA: tetratricopeptide repeat protein [Chitinophagaceae bacterium]|nr:tetratricopeptide repeat protein [Chitinophagaceae bacterium]
MDRISQLEDFRQNNPRDCFIRHALAMEYIKADRDLEAINLLEEILQEDPNYSGSYYHLGKLYEKSGNILAARDIYHKGMQVTERISQEKEFKELKGAYEALENE